MDTGSSLLAARGLTDERDRLLTADEPLADLHERCGGAIPGTLAVPELLELVRQGRQLGLKIAREFSAFDGDELVTGFVRINPLGGSAGGGCEVLVENWHRVQQQSETVQDIADRLDAIDRAAAEIVARLDGQQRMQLLSALSSDSAEFQQAINDNPGQVWTEYVELVGVAHQQPLHWRLLDGARCTIPGSERNWRVRLSPIGSAIGSASGFELIMVADEPIETASLADDGSEDDQAHARMIGSTLTPALRQPIARVIANAETMRARLAGPLRAEYSEYAGNIAAAGQHLSGMLDDLADLEVVEAPGFSTIKEQVDLTDAARRAAGILGVRAADRGITIDLPGEGSAIIAIGEFRRVLQILINLIGNAIAYSPENSAIVIDVAVVDEGNVALSVVDQGPGIDEQQALQIFEKFERLGRSNDGGSGLGLYISKRLAKAMEGDLMVDSPNAGGAQFTLSLPKAS